MLYNKSIFHLLFQQREGPPVYCVLYMHWHISDEYESYVRCSKTSLSEAQRAEEEVKWIGLGENWNMAAILSKREKIALSCSEMDLKSALALNPLCCIHLFLEGVWRGKEILCISTKMLYFCRPLHSLAEIKSSLYTCSVQRACCSAFIDGSTAN